ncbi:MFS transporter [Streptomyces sp. SB3404]|uniref:MFS transporter n=1 Tax=Streptomyces boncukensis TaxID=2711219 RepID=A0A6G4X6S7_9ACTN|nr:MFS transporter [Streptomyces boncukensis]NGO72842.1 MFS transporter [Streptomyces boncukensis]
MPLSVLSLTLGIFALVTTEILPVGLLTSLGSDFAVSDGMAGLTMTMPGLLAAPAAPLLTVATARADRRRVLCAFMALLTLANVLVAVADAYWLVLVSRVLVGVTIGGFWSVAAGLAGRLVPARSAGRATAVIFSAVPLGSVLGVPAGTFLGDLAGWRTAFAAMAVLSAGVLALMLLVLPPLPPPAETTRPAVLRALVRRRGTRLALLVTFLVVLAHFGTYTYVGPFLERVTRMGPGSVTLCLLAYGVAGVCGNFAGGWAVVRHPRAVFGAAAGTTGGALLLLPLLGGNAGGAAALLAVWGFAYGAVPVASQRWFANAAPGAPEAASVLFTASFQATISLGALAGGAVVDASSPPALMAAGGAVAVLALAVIALPAAATRPPAGAARGSGPPGPRSAPGSGARDRTAAGG